MGTAHYARVLQSFHGVVGGVYPTCCDRLLQHHPIPRPQQRLCNSTFFLSSSVRFTLSKRLPPSALPAASSWFHPCGTWTGSSSSRLRLPSRILALWDLGAGERMTLHAAMCQKADRVLIDEKIGRNRAEYLGLNVTGTLGVVLRARQRGLVPSSAAQCGECTLHQDGDWCGRF